MKFLHRLIGGAAAAACAVALLASVGYAAGPYSQNTSGTTADGQLQALGDIVDAVTGATPAGENHLGAVGGNTVLATCSFTRPADTTQYAAGDLVANSTAAGAVSPCALTVARVDGGSGMIRRLVLSKSGTALTGADFRVHLYRTCTITAANGDNGAWSTDGAADDLGAIDVSADTAFTDGAAGIGTPDTGSEINFVAPAGTQTVCALIEARGTYTPASGETFTLTAEVLQN